MFAEPLAAVVRALPDIRGKTTLGTLLTQVVTPKEPALVRMKRGDVFQVNPSEIMGRRAFWTGRFDDYDSAALCGLLQKEGAVVLDVGANIGFYGIPLARRVKALHGKLWAFEPVQANYELLRKNLKLNGVDGVATTVQCGLGDEKGTFSMVVESKSAGNAVVGRDDVPPGHRIEQVAIDTLDRYTSEHAIERCDLMKLDAEGYEVRVLEGGMGFVAKTRPIIYGKFNEGWMAAQGHTYQDVANLLVPLGYRVFHMLEGEMKPAADPYEFFPYGVVFVPNEREEPAVS